MNFQRKLKTAGKAAVWAEYCGFLDLGMNEFMYIQRRLMEEQIRLWSDCGLGRELLHGEKPFDIDDFRRVMPLTEYGDYADVLLARRADMLPDEPVIWIQTTWEGGLHPVKLAPYTRDMLDAYKHNTLASILLSGKRKGEITIKKGDRVLYGGAPLPFATGLLPSLLNEEIKLNFLPDDNSSGVSFSERVKAGFKMGMESGIDYFFGLSSVANYITANFASASGSSASRGRVGIPIALRYLKAKYESRRDGTPIKPGDIFRLKAFFCTGTDTSCYRNSLEKAWGIRTTAIMAGTECSCIASETWEKHGLVFFPNVCFYEFIPEDEMLRNLADPQYTPRTCLMDEVKVGQSYELVISVLHGGAFMRYRIGDMFRCVLAEPGAIPYFHFVDRVPNVIDIAGFTRITEQMITEVIRISRLDIGDWLAKKEFDSRGYPYLHMYVELSPDAQLGGATGRQLLTDHLAAYFRYFDSDYHDLKKLLGMEPLVLTILKYGTIAGYQQQSGRTLQKIGPSAMDVSEMLRFQGLPDRGGGGWI